MRYLKHLKHLKANWIVAIKAMLLFILNFALRLIPCKFTKHSYWNFKL